jgi:hypothetical protein
MNDTRGYYSVIQYCPDRSRAEAANVGVLLFCPDAGFIEARVAKGNDRIARFFGRGGFEPEQVNMAKDAIVNRVRFEADRFREPGDLVTFIDTRANEIILTPPRAVRVRDPRKELEELFSELVGGRRRKEKATEPMIPELDSFMRSKVEGDRGHVFLSFSVHVPKLAREIRVPYAFLNGGLNLVQPQRFGDDTRKAFDAAIPLALEGDLLRKLPQAHQLVVVSADDDVTARDEIERPLRELFGDYHVQFLARRDLPELKRRVERAQ